MIGEWLLCDFHIHTTYSDRKLSLRDVVDTYDGNDFDVISITDHVLDMKTVEKLEKMNKAVRSLRREDFEEYLHTLWEKARRAWERHDSPAPLFDAWEVANRDDLYNVLEL